ncbi:MAG: SRPBCC domain-containing protein [Bacteroidota bacterium]|nr:SRPBCC domain-containing protein [Bacteroidota bacterium]
MKTATTDFTTTLLVSETTEEVFNAINHVRGWWSEEIEGNTDKLNNVFNYHYEDIHRCKIKLTEVVPNERIVWLVLDNYFKFTKDKSEWIDTKIIFEISAKDGNTQLRFTHQGLVPEYECYDICRNAWSNYIQNSLSSLITTGKGQPNGKGKPQTEHEKKLAVQQN